MKSKDGSQWIKAVEALEEISIDHYPETVFKPIPDDEWFKIVRYIKRKYSLDAISGHYGRFFHKMHRDIAQAALKQIRESGQRTPADDAVEDKDFDAWLEKNYQESDFPGFWIDRDNWIDKNNPYYRMEDLKRKYQSK